MATTKIIKDHHSFSRNLKLNGNYISNDGDNEGFSITDSGVITLSPQGQAVFEFDYNADLIMKRSSDLDDYFKISVMPNGATTLSTVDDSGSNQADIIFTPQGDIQLNAGANSKVVCGIGTKTASGTIDASLTVTETLNLSSGAGGSDTHYGIRYVQTQTDLTGWDDVYLMHLYVGDTTKQFIVHADGTVQIGFQSPLAWTASARITNSSHALTMTGSTLTLDSSGDVILDADGDQVSMKFGGATGQIDFTNANSGDGIIQQKVDAKDLVIQQYDGDEVVRFTDGGDVKVTNTVYFAAETANTIGDGATGAIDWNVSQKQKVTITGTGITCNFTNPSGPCNLLLKVVQGDGSDVIATWDSDIKWPSNGTAPTLSTGNGDIDIISFYFDGTNYFGVASLDFA